MAEVYRIEEYRNFMQNKIKSKKRCPKCKIIKHKKYFYKKLKDYKQLSSYCIICSRIIQRERNVLLKDREKKSIKKQNVINIHKGTELTRLMRKAYPLPDPQEYIVCAQRFLGDLNITLRQIKKDKINVKDVRQGRDWGNFLIDLRLLKKQMEDF